MKKLQVAVIGSGGREHAIAWALAKNESIERIFCVPGNAGTACEKKCENIAVSSVSDITNIVRTLVHLAVDFTVIGPEDPLAAGLCDSLWDNGIVTVGPKKSAAQLEASKDTAKHFMQTYGVACAKSKTFICEEAALEYLAHIGVPCVVKADGLAAGKGVVVASTIAQAQKAVHDFMAEHTLGDAGKKIIIEEYLQGSEVSILAAVSVTPELAENANACIVPFICARDHKRLLDGAQGPNTGGMGAIAPVADVTQDIYDMYIKTILEPTLRGLIGEKYDYRGFIFFGVMLTKDGPKLLEYNVRLGDPETQAVLPLMDFDFADMCLSICDGNLKSFQFAWKKGFVCAPVAVSGGYPAQYEKHKHISLAKIKTPAQDVKVFAAGAVINNSGGASGDQWYTSGGRVLSVAAYGETAEEARVRAYEVMDTIHFDGMFFRHDIGIPGAADSIKITGV